jgi:hypothetical protein
MSTQISQQNLKELYDKDFYLWIQKNIELLKSKNFDAVDWINLIEELEDMGRRYIDSLISFMTIILEHLYKWEHFRIHKNMGNSWVHSILNARNHLLDLLEKHPSLQNKPQEFLETAWKSAVRRLISWFKKPENIPLAKKSLVKSPLKTISLIIAPILTNKSSITNLGLNHKRRNYVYTNISTKPQRTLR